MARPQRCRRVCREPMYCCFRPSQSSNNSITLLTVDEYETVRLVDYKKMTHEQCAKIMNISRTTATEIYELARFKIADSLVNGKVIQISGGNYKLCDGSAGVFCMANCKRGKLNRFNPEICEKGDNQMRIAVTYENGMVFQHFGHTEEFKLYDVEENRIVKEQILDTNGTGHGALADFLRAAKVDILICGGIGGGAQNALAQAGVKLYGGVSGEADKAVENLLSNSLDFNPDVKCDHHDHDENHQCGENTHGCGGHNCGN